MEFSEIIQTGRCCISGKPLVSSKNINMVQLDYLAMWQYPIAGNLITGEYGRAVAFVHDDMVNEQGAVIGKIIEAVEFKEGRMVYHPVSELYPVPAFPDITNPMKRCPPERSCRVCGCTDWDCTKCIEATGQPCSWVDKDLCSRCETSS